MKIISPDATLLLLGLASIASVTQSDPQPGKQAIMLAISSHLLPILK